MRYLVSLLRNLTEGLGAPVGTVHKRADGEYKKMAGGMWEPLPHQQPLAPAQDAPIPEKPGVQKVSVKKTKQTPEPELPSEAPTSSPVVPKKSVFLTPVVRDKFAVPGSMITPDDYLRGPLGFVKQTKAFSDAVAKADFDLEDPGSFIGGGNIGAFDIQLDNKYRVIAKNSGTADTDVSYDVREALHAHGIVHRLAEDMEAGHLLLPATGIEAPGSQIFFGKGKETSTRKLRFGDELFVTQHAGDDFSPGGVDFSATDAISEEDRLSAAILHFITDQRDGHMNNLLVDGKGALKLIDHDLIFGRNIGEYTVDNRSVFFPGGRVGPRAEYPEFNHLPDRIKKVVHSISEMTEQDMAERYGMKPDEARLCTERCQALREQGLLAIRSSGAVALGASKAKKSGKKPAAKKPVPKKGSK